MSFWGKKKEVEQTGWPGDMSPVQEHVFNELKLWINTTGTGK